MNSYLGISLFENTVVSLSTVKMSHKTKLLIFHLSYYLLKAPNPPTLIVGITNNRL